MTGRLSLFDVPLLAAARAAGGTLLLSDDMQDGAGFGGLVVRNPSRGERLPADLVPLLGFG